MFLARRLASRVLVAGAVNGAGVPGTATCSVIPSRGFEFFSSSSSSATGSKKSGGATSASAPLPKEVRFAFGVKDGTGEKVSLSDDGDATMSFDERFTDKGKPREVLVSGLPLKGLVSLNDVRRVMEEQFGETQRVRFDLLNRNAFVTFRRKEDARKANEAGEVELPEGTVSRIRPHRFRKPAPTRSYKVYRDDGTIGKSSEMDGQVPGSETFEEEDRMYLKAKLDLLKSFQEGNNDIRVEQLDETLENWEDGRVFLWNGRRHHGLEIREWLDERWKIRDKVLHTSVIQPKAVPKHKKSTYGKRYIRTIRNKGKPEVTVYATGKNQLRPLKTRRRNRLKKRTRALAEGRR